MQMKQKVLCSVCSALFRHDGTQKVVDLQGVFVLFLCLFHCSIYIYNLRGAKNRLTLLTNFRIPVGVLYIWNNGTFIYIDKKTPLKSMTCIKKVCSVGTEQSGTNGTENLLLHLHQHRAPSSSSGNYHEKIATKKRTKKKPAVAG